MGGGRGRPLFKGQASWGDKLSIPGLRGCPPGLTPEWLWSEMNGGIVPLDAPWAGWGLGASLQWKGVGSWGVGWECAGLGLFVPWLLLHS